MRATQEAANAWATAAQGKTWNYLRDELLSVDEQYEMLRERYATGVIRLGDFEAEVTILLRDGL